MSENQYLKKKTKRDEILEDNIIIGVIRVLINNKKVRILNCHKIQK